MRRPVGRRMSGSGAGVLSGIPVWARSPGPAVTCTRAQGPTLEPRATRDRRWRIQRRARSALVSPVDHRPVDSARRHATDEADDHPTSNGICAADSPTVGTTIPIRDVIPANDHPVTKVIESWGPSFRPAVRRAHNPHAPGSSRGSVSHASPFAPDVHRMRAQDRRPEELCQSRTNPLRTPSTVLVSPAHPPAPRRPVRPMRAPGSSRHPARG